MCIIAKFDWWTSLCIVTSGTKKYLWASWRDPFFWIKLKDKSIDIFTHSAQIRICTVAVILTCYWRVIMTAYVIIKYFITLLFRTFAYTCPPDNYIVINYMFNFEMYTTRNVQKSTDTIFASSGKYFTLALAFNYIAKFPYVKNELFSYFRCRVLNCKLFLKKWCQS